MKGLKELVSLVDKQGIKKLNVLTPNNKDGKLFDLYEGVRDGVFKTDEMAIQELYGESGSKGAYKKLKSRLQAQLMNTVLLNEEKGILTKADIYREVAIFSTLILKGALNNAFTYGKRLLRKITEKEYTDLCLLVSSQMRFLSERRGDMVKFKYYNELTHKYQKLLDAELIAKEYNQHITIHFIKTQSFKPELIAKAKKFSAHLKQFDYARENSETFCYLEFNLSIVTYEMAGDVERVHELCQEAISYFEQKQTKVKLRLLFFLFKDMTFYIKNKEFEEGKKTNKRILDYTIRRKGRNHFIAVEQFILLALFCKKYDLAYESFIEAIKIKEFEFLPSAYKEQWDIYQAFFEYLKATGILNSLSEKSNKKYRMGKFINNVPEYSKDKMGFNIAILIIQYLYLLQTKKYDAVIDRVDGLRVYAYRYLRKKETMRSYYFIKMLLEIPEAQFHKEGVRRRAAKHLKKLNALPHLESMDTGEIERIPYEDLWEIVLDNLSAKFVKIKTRG